MAAPAMCAPVTSRAGRHGAAIASTGVAGVAGGAALHRRRRRRLLRRRSSAAAAIAAAGRLRLRRPPPLLLPRRGHPSRLRLGARRLRRRRRRVRGLALRRRHLRGARRVAARALDLATQRMPLLQTEQIGRLRRRRSVGRRGLPGGGSGGCGGRVGHCRARRPTAHPRRRIDAAIALVRSKPMASSVSAASSAPIVE